MNVLTDYRLDLLAQTPFCQNGKRIHKLCHSVKVVRRVGCDLYFLLVTRCWTILTKEDDRRHHQEGVRAAHFVNGYIKRERKKKRKELEEDETSSHSSNSRGEEITLTYHLMYIPRILKNDLRRQYPIMFANVYNSCDYDFMMKFIHQLCDLTGRVTMRDTYAQNGKRRLDFFLFLIFIYIYSRFSLYPLL